MRSVVNGFTFCPAVVFFVTRSLPVGKKVVLKKLFVASEKCLEKKDLTYHMFMHCFQIFGELLTCE